MTRARQTTGGSTGGKNPRKQEIECLWKRRNIEITNFWYCCQCNAQNKKDELYCDGGGNRQKTHIDHRQCSKCTNSYHPKEYLQEDDFWVCHICKSEVTNKFFCDIKHANKEESERHNRCSLCPHYRRCPSCDSSKLLNP